jgi:hypothetical protein
MTIPDTLRRNQVAVTVYYDNRLYGGPEEGGWWYTSPEVVEAFLFTSLRKARVFMRQYLAEGLERGYRVRMEFPGFNPRPSGERDGAEREYDCRPFYKRELLGRKFGCGYREVRGIGALRPLFRGRELVARPYYC